MGAALEPRVSGGVTGVQRVGGGEWEQRRGRVSGDTTGLGGSDCRPPTPTVFPPPQGSSITTMGGLEHRPASEPNHLLGSGMFSGSCTSSWGPFRSSSDSPLSPGRGTAVGSLSCPAVGGGSVRESTCVGGLRTTWACARGD